VANDGDYTLEDSEIVVGASSDMPSILITSVLSKNHALRSVLALYHLAGDEGASGRQVRAKMIKRRCVILAVSKQLVSHDAMAGERSLITFRRLMDWSD